MDDMKWNNIIDISCYGDFADEHKFKLIQGVEIFHSRLKVREIFIIPQVSALIVLYVIHNFDTAAIADIVRMEKGIIQNQ